MRFSSLSLLLGGAALAVASSESDNDEVSPTTFNSITVPPLLELTPHNHDAEMKASKYIFVKHYNPFCPHCLDFAPTFQTAYEFYYTSKPEIGPTDANFEKYYDFRFAVINCLANYDLCVANGVQSYPTTVLFENGKEIGKVSGGKNITAVSAVIETALEGARPGSRAQEFDLPEPGDATPPKGKNPWKHASTIDTLSKAGNKESKKQSAAVNNEGITVELTAETFQRRVTLSQEPWFIKFYAPWCPHCQAMAPTWDQLAKNMQGKLNIGEVNCEKESRLCKDVHARAFPTILFFKGGERVEYKGLRGLGDFVQYAEKAVELANGVPDVTAAEFEAMEEDNEVIFVYFYDHATTSEDMMALERLPLNLVGHAKLVKTNDPKLYNRFKITTWPRLLVSREGRPTYYPPLTPDAMRDVNGVLDWMRSVWLPLVPELTVVNARQIMDQKIVVLSVLNRADQDSYQGAIREMKSAANEWMDRQIQEFQLERKKMRDAKQMRIEEAEDRDDQRALRSAKAIRINMDNSGRKEVGFAWVDGATWQRWIRTTYGIDVKDGERVIINDQDSRRYWDTSVTGNYILVSRTSILETLDKIVYGPQVLKPKLTISFIEKIFFDIRVAFTEHTLLSIGCLAALSLVGVWWLRGRSRRARGHFRLDDSMGIRDLKEGLLGSNGNAKSD